MLKATENTVEYYFNVIIKKLSEIAQKLDVIETDIEEIADEMIAEEEEPA
jgi:hypothetical protein